MSKKSLKGMVKNYFTDNYRMMGICVFVFVIMLLISTLFSKQSGGILFTLFALAIPFVLVLLLIYGKVWYVTLVAYSDIKHSRFNKTNIKFKELREDKGWILWNSNPQNSATCKYIATDINGNEYRICTTCSYQNVKAVEKFLVENKFRIVALEKSKLIICIQHNPADFTNKKEAHEVEETTRKLFGPFFYSFSVKND